MKLWRADYQTSNGKESAFATSERKLRAKVKKIKEDMDDPEFRVFSMQKIDVPTTAERLAHWLTVEMS